MKVSETVAGFFESHKRTNVLSTAGKNGKVNTAVFGSPMLVGDSKIRMLLGDNRTFANLKDNPFAALLVTMHGKTGFAMEGCRLYLKKTYIKDDGDEFDEVLGAIRKRIGDGANILKHLAVFDILEVRPIADFGQEI